MPLGEFMQHVKCCHELVPSAQLHLESTIAARHILSGRGGGAAGGEAATHDPVATTKASPRTCVIAATGKR
jgi:hypothetical protein